MKTDDERNTLLQAWKVDAALPPRFKEEVWRRIGQREPRATTKWQEIRRWVDSWSPRPVWAGAYFVGVIAISAWAGLSSAEHYRAEAVTSWRSAYVQSVSPIAQANLRP